MSLLSHFLAALSGGCLGFLICAMSMTAALADLEEENNELRSLLNTWAKREQHQQETNPYD
jgi:hypothetical protein